MRETLDGFWAEAARRWPDHDAYRCKDAALSYQDLHARARNVAATLVGLGVAKGDRVAIGMTKGLEMPVAIQGIWMAGAAFVPLDPTAPTERLATVLEACDISVVIGSPRDTSLLTALAAARDITILGADIDGTRCVQIDPAPQSFAPLDNAASDLAYVMFTSGSTGVPKGMAHTHASGAAFARMWANLYGLQADDILFCTVPLHFDFSLADFLATPLAGACTELVPEVVQRFPASLAAELERSRATIWSTVPYTLIQLRERGGAEARDLSSLRWVIFGGEPFAPRQLAAVREIIDADFSNSYGPAEVNQVTEYTVPASHPLDSPIPIGHPTDHAMLAVGEDGELLVAAPSMMRGYWHRDDLNDAAFVERNGTRFYRTGDSVSQDNAGLWHFGGRADRQIKLRGYRIELDEIEHALCSHPAVSEAAVVLSADAESLTAHATLAPGASVDIAELTRHIETQLPRYAIPASIQLRDDLPRTGTGKIDRRALKGQAA